MEDDLKFSKEPKTYHGLLRMAKVKDLPVESPIQEDEKSPDITLTDGTETRNYCERYQVVKITKNRMVIKS